MVYSESLCKSTRDVIHMHKVQLLRSSRLHFKKLETIEQPVTNLQ